MRRPLRLGIVASHPVQYHAPLYRQLAATPDVDPTVLFAHRPTPEEQGHGFGVAFEWDSDLTAGYHHVWLRNRARDPGANAFTSFDTPEVGAEIERRRFDVVLVMGWHALAFWQAMRTCWARRIPLLVRGDSQLPTDAAALKRAVKRAVYPLFLRRFAACLSVGSRSAEYFRYYGARRVVPAPHFVDNEHFAAAADRSRPLRGELRRRWGLAEDAIVFLFAGKLIDKKRPMDLLRGLARARATDAAAVFVGAGSLLGELEDEARRLGVTARFVGFLNQSEIPAAYAAADALVLPSDARETWGLVVNEAMAAGCPAIVSDAAGCAPDLVVSGVTGYHFPVGDVDALAARLTALGAPGTDRTAMGRAARRHVMDHFSVRHATDGVVEAALGALPR